MAEHISFEVIVAAARKVLRQKSLPDIYTERLDFEISEVDKQGANRYWEDILSDERKFDSNPNYLLLPWLLGLLTGDADCDPVKSRDDMLCSSDYSVVIDHLNSNGDLPPDIFQDRDQPDIDIDCLPEARDEIKKYAISVYGENNVCSVGTMGSYLLRQAIQDTTKAMGGNKSAAVKLTTKLPDEVDELREGGYSTCKGKIFCDDGEEKECKVRHNAIKCPSCGSADTDTPTFVKLLAEHDALRAYYESSPENQEIMDTALGLIGRYKSVGKHAGALIISDRDLFGAVPMYKRNDQWVSLWTEGRNTQLSKFGYNKWDILGLKNHKYIYECCKMIERNHGISFGDRMQGWDKIDPEEGYAGCFWTEDGKEHRISLADEGAFKLANELRVEAVFQFDTELARQNLAHGVRDFNDLMIINAMGHPGPMAMIPEYIKRRDDPKQSWKDDEHPKIIEALEETHGIIVYQEQLQALWQSIAGFTAPEAQDARKAVAKKWRELLKPVRQRWIDGADKVIGRESATEWWDERMEPFGRYAFNRAHAVSYCLVAYRCLWLKAHFAEEWWATVMSYCHAKELWRFMSVARGEGTKFSSFNVERLSALFTVSKKQVHLGLLSLKNVGAAKADEFADDTKQEYVDIDDFIAKKGKHKTVLERLIKLGAFRRYHPNVQATWIWYQFKYGSGKDVTVLRNHIKREILKIDGWDDDKIREERDRQTVVHKQLYPKRKLPKKIDNWKPKPDCNREAVMALWTEDYGLEDLLEYEKEYLGYYWHSPVDLYRLTDDLTIADAKIGGVVEGVITKTEDAKTRNDTNMRRIILTDGLAECLIIAWSDHIEGCGDILQPGVGVRCKVDFDKARGSFTLSRGSLAAPLMKKTDWEEYAMEDL